MAGPVSWGAFDDRFVSGLAEWIGGRAVLEVFAGNGLLASLLSARGVDILPTTLFSGHDGHDRGMHFDVLELEAAEAVRRHGKDRDILLMSWPTATEAAIKAAALWGPERPLIFIGEVTRPELGFGGLGGCASDLFFDLTEEIEAFGFYSPRNMLEKAAVRRLDQAALKTWMASQADQDANPAFKR